MHTKGSAFFARRDLVIGEVGQQRWDAFLAAFAEGCPLFREPILSTTRIPIEDFVALNDALIDRFYAGDAKTYWRFGEASADWAFSKGPYQRFFRSHSFAEFTKTTPLLWKAYYDEGELKATWDDATNVAQLAIVNLPIMHALLEYGVMGYGKRGFELSGGRVTSVEALKGVDTGDHEIVYQFHVA